MTRHFQNTCLIMCICEKYMINHFSKYISQHIVCVHTCEFISSVGINWPTKLLYFAKQLAQLQRRSTRRNCLSSTWLHHWHCWHRTCQHSTPAIVAQSMVASPGPSTSPCLLIKFCSMQVAFTTFSALPGRISSTLWYRRHRETRWPKAFSTQLRARESL